MRTVIVAGLECKGSIPSDRTLWSEMKGVHMSPRDKRPSVTARVLSLLNAFDAESPELTLAQLSRRVGMPKSTVHRLVGELSDGGLLERAGSTWRLGFRLFELGLMVPSSATLRHAALPVMEDLSAASSQTVHLAVREGREIVYVEILRPPRDVTLPSRVGGRMPISCTGVGKVMLAFASSAVIDDVMASDLPKLTPYTQVMPGLLRRDLQQIRERGVAYDKEQATVGVSCVAAPILDAEGTATAAISVTGPAVRMDLERLTPAVAIAARTITRRLLEPRYPSWR